MRRQPKFVLIVQTIVIPAASVLLVLIGVSWTTSGRTDEAPLLFAIAGAFLLSILIYYALFHSLGRIAGRRAIKKAVALHSSPTTALHQATEALRALVPEGEPDVEKERSRVAIEVPSGWWTFGERVSVMIRPTERGSVAEVASDRTFRQLMRFEENFASVDTVIDALAAFERDGIG